MLAATPGVSGLHAILAAAPGIEVVAGDGLEALEPARVHRPDVAPRGDRMAGEAELSGG